MQANDLSVTETAATFGITQPALSNYLSGRSSISYQLLERMLDILNIPESLLNADSPGIQLDLKSAIALVSHQSAFSTRRCTPELAERHFIVNFSVLNRLPSYCSVERRRDWTRFVAIEVNAEQSAFMRPLYKDRDHIVIDRHYQRIDSVFRDRRPIYAIAEMNRLLLAYVSVSDHNTHLNITPHAVGAISHEIYFDDNPDTSRFIVGRICQGPNYC